MGNQNNIPKPTEAELEVLQVLWQKGESTVRQVHDTINPNGETGYTTTLKIMQIMQAKGLLCRRAEGRTHIYQAVVDEKPTRQRLLDRFMQTTFQGSSASLVMQALGSANTTKEELKEIRNLLDTLEGGEK